MPAEDEARDGVRDFAMLLLVGVVGLLDEDELVFVSLRKVAVDVLEKCGVSGALAVIIDVARKMQGICRRAKKNMKRLGSLYWSKLDTWDALRRAI